MTRAARIRLHAFAYLLVFGGGVIAGEHNAAERARIHAHYAPRPVPPKPAVYDWIDCVETLRICKARKRMEGMGAPSPRNRGT